MAPPEAAARLLEEDSWDSNASTDPLSNAGIDLQTYEAVLRAGVIAGLGNAAAASLASPDHEGGSPGVAGEPAFYTLPRGTITADPCDWATTFHPCGEREPHRQWSVEELLHTYTRGDPCFQAPRNPWSVRLAPDGAVVRVANLDLFWDAVREATSRLSTLSRSFTLGRATAGVAVPAIRAGLSVDFEQRLWNAVEADEVENGVRHPGEDILQEAIGTLGDQAHIWMTEVVLAASSTHQATPLLVLASRAGCPAPTSLRRRLLEWALDQQNLELRDAAVQACEHWEDSGLIDLLQKHEEPEGWLEYYIERVIRDLSEE